MSGEYLVHATTSFRIHSQTGADSMYVAPLELVFMRYSWSHWLWYLLSTCSAFFRGGEEDLFDILTT